MKEVFSILFILFFYTKSAYCVPSELRSSSLETAASLITKLTEAVTQIQNENGGELPQDLSNLNSTIDPVLIEIITKLNNTNMYEVMLSALYLLQNAPDLSSNEQVKKNSKFFDVFKELNLKSIDGFPLLDYVQNWRKHSRSAVSDDELEYPDNEVIEKMQEIEDIFDLAIERLSDKK